MSEVPPQKNISKVRTFAKDAARIQEGSQPTVPQQEIIHKTVEIPAQKTIQKNIPTTNRAPSVEVFPTQLSKKEANKQNPYVQPQKIETLVQEISEVTKLQKKSILSDDSSYENVVGSGGTIIRDTKRKRFRLIPAMVIATTDWFNNAKEEYFTGKNPIHTVEKAEVRASVIKKAASKSEQAPIEDFDEVSKHLKQVERVPATATLTFKKKIEVPPPTWSYTTEKTENEAPPIRPTESVAFTPVSITKETTPVFKEPASVVGEEKLAPTDKPARKEPTKLNFFQSLFHTKENTATKVAKKEKVSAPKPRIENATPEQPRTDKTTVINKIKPFPLYIFISVIIIASISGITISYYLFEKNDSVQEKVVIETIPSLVTTTSTAALELSGTRTDILKSLLSYIESQSDIVQLYPTITDETGVQKPATPEATLQKLATHTSGSFNRSVKEIVFGGIEGTEPFIVLKITSFDIAFAGILEWEKTLSADLSPLFGEPVLETFDVSARTATQLREAFYQDVLASNKSARVLLDETGADRIVYTFVDQQTILITTTRDALTKILPLVK